MLVIPEDHYQATFHHDTTGTLRQAVCTLGLHYVGADFVNQANDVRLAWANAIMAQLSNQVGYIRFTLATQEGIVNDFPMAVGGSETDGMAPPNVAYLVKKVTSQPGKRNRGRMYLPGVNELDLDAVGTVATIKRTPLQTAITAFYDAVIAADFQPVLFHNDTDAEGNPVAPELTVPTNLTALTLDARVATQRRRLRG